jgi:hypothetical protein
LKRRAKINRRSRDEAKGNLTMKVCNQCQSPQIDAAKFCNECGKALEVQSTIVEPAKRQASIKPVIITVAVFIALGIWAQFRNAGNVSEASTVQATQAATPFATATPLDPLADLQRAYRNLVVGLYSNYNGIEIKLVKLKGGGYSLMAYHDFFSEYTFSAGEDAREIQAFVYRHHEALKTNKIKRVGVWGTGPYSSGTWYNVN